MGIQDVLAAMQGNSAGLTGGDATNPPLPPPNYPPEANALPAPAQPPAPPQRPPYQPPPPQVAAQQTQGIKGYLSDMFYQMGEAGKKHIGLQTDAEKQQIQFKQSLDSQREQADTLEKEARTKYLYAQAKQKEGVPATAQEAITYGIPIGTPLTPQDRQVLDKQVLQNKGKTDVAGINATSRVANVDPIKKALAEAKAASDAGDDATYKSKLAEVTQLLTAKSKATTPSEIGMIIKANQGDADAQKVLDVLQQRRMSLQSARGAAFGKARLWALQKVYDPDTGETDFATGFDILASQQQGKHLIPTGALPADKVIAVQQLQSEAKPALSQVRAAMPAFDNAADRAIFARVIKNAGTPGHGDEASWMGNVMNQALKEGLSPQGQQLAIAQGRLAETLGRMRSVLGLQATDSAMALTLRLMPGASTPNSKYASQQLDTLDQMINQAVNIPALGGKNRRAVPSVAPVKQKQWNPVKGIYE